MKLKVPFILQTTPVNCATSALRMVVAYFDKDVGIEKIEKLTGVKEGKSTFTIQLAIAARKLGYSVDFYTISALFNEEHMKKEIYQKFADMDLERSKKLLINAKKLGVNIFERHVLLSEILNFVSKESLPIILLDWNIVTGKNNNVYQGHFVVITGYDDKFVYVHNHGLDNSAPNFAIPRKVFEKARIADGTDEDIVVVHRK